MCRRSPLLGVPDRERRTAWDSVSHVRLLTIAAVALVAAAANPVGAGARSSDRAAALAVYGGLGSWLDIFASDSWSSPRAIVAVAKEHGVRTLYLQTSNYSQTSDVVRPAALGGFIDAAHADGLKVVAWYLPGLYDMRMDARRAVAAIRFRSRTGQAFDGFALDIEASIVRSVGERNDRLLALARLLRASTPPSYPLGAIIPSPVGMRRHPHYWPHFPYVGLARSFDAFLPMAYFSYYAHSAGAAYSYARDVVLAIRRGTARPDVLIHLIGGSSTDIPGATLAGFARAVSDCAVQGFSLYAFPETDAEDWSVLTTTSLAPAPSSGCSATAVAP